MCKSFHEYIFENFKRYFPSIAEKTVHWYPSGRHEITVRLNDRSKVYFNDLTKGVRRVPEYDDSEKMSEEEWRDRFGTKLADVINDKGISQRDLAEAIGVSTIMISKYINGKTSPSSYTLSKLAKVLECTVSELTDF